MEGYRLYTVVPYLVQFSDNLTNIYVRYNRRRLKGGKGDDDARMALAVLYDVIMTLNRTMAPFTPFFTEHMYQNLRTCDPEAPESIHWMEVPPARAIQEGDEHIQVSK